MVTEIKQHCYIDQFFVKKNYIQANFKHFLQVFFKIQKTYKEKNQYWTKQTAPFFAQKL